MTTEEKKEKKKAYQKAYREANSEKRKAYYKANPEKFAANAKAYYKANPEKNAARRKVYREANPEKIPAYQKVYREENKERAKARQKAYNDENKEKRKAYWANRYKTDSLYRISVNIHSSVSTSYKKKGLTPPKTQQLLEILGCSFNQLETHLIAKALSNYGYWADFQAYEIDHIIPLATATCEEDLVRLNHHSNLQFLYPHHNMAKSSKLDWVIPVDLAA